MLVVLLLLVNLQYLVLDFPHGGWRRTGGWVDIFYIRYVVSHHEKKDKIMFFCCLLQQNGSNPQERVRLSNIFHSDSTQLRVFTNFWSKQTQSNHITGVPNKKSVGDNPLCNSSLHCSNGASCFGGIGRYHKLWSMSERQRCHKPLLLRRARKTASIFK